jgi:hypothetical protein
LTESCPYWSRVLKPAERNYSPTEREALALKEGLIKFQPYIEGETILAITDHAALTWSKTFQNVNRRLLTWGTVFLAYPNLKIVHSAGRVHSNVDPISRLRRRVPIQEGPATDTTKHISLNLEEDALRNMYEELGPKFEEQLITVASNFATELLSEIPDYVYEGHNMVEFPLMDGKPFCQNYYSSTSYSILVGLSPEELNIWKEAFTTDETFSKVITAYQDISEGKDKYPQYQVRSNGLVYFEDWNGNFRLCVPDSLQISIMDELHNTLTESAHGGYTKTYNRTAATYYWPGMSRDIK